MIEHYSMLATTVSIGIVTGTIYGYIFGYSQRTSIATTFSHRNNIYAIWLNVVCTTIMRCVFCFAYVFYLLPLPKIHFILLLIVFIVAFWTTILSLRMNA